MPRKKSEFLTNGFSTPATTSVTWDKRWISAMSTCLVTRDGRIDRNSTVYSVRTYIHITWLHMYYKYFFRILYSSVVPFIHDTEDVHIHILHTLLIVSNIFPSTLSRV